MTRLGLALLVSLVLLVAVGGGSLLLSRRLERDYLADLERQMGITAQALAHEAPSLIGDLPRLQDLVTHIERESGSRIRIISSQGQMLADSVRPVAGNEPAERAVLDRPEVQRALRGGYGAWTRYADDSAQSLALYVAVPALDSSGRIVCVVYVSHNTDEIIARLDRFRVPMRTVLVVLSLAVVIVAALLAWSVLRQLERVRDTSRQMATGAIETRVEARGNDDIAQIAAHFNALAGSLQTKVVELEGEKDKTRRFIQEITHELKTPLTGLRGSVDALLGGAMDDPETQRRFVQNIERDAERLSALVGELLEVQKLEYAELKRERFDLGSLAESVADSFDDARMEVETAGAVVVEADAAKIRRVLENLVENALRHSPPDAPVKVRVAADRVVVEDRGPGVPSDERDRIFERFYRGSRAVEGRLGGAGLGLAIAREIVVRHGGRIGVEGEEGEGARFYFTIG